MYTCIYYTYVMVLGMHKTTVQIERTCNDDLVNDVYTDPLLWLVLVVAIS